MRVKTAAWRALARSVDEFDLAELDPQTRRMAVLVDGLGSSRVLDLGFGMGEALIVATQRDPDRMLPLIRSACEYGDDELRGAGTSPGVSAAVLARNALITAARELLDAAITHPTLHVASFRAGPRSIDAYLGHERCGRRQSSRRAELVSKAPGSHRLNRT